MPANRTTPSETHKIMLSRLMYTLMSLAVMHALGCGGGAPDRAALVPVSGKVTVNGQPMAGISVIFSPSDVIGGTAAGGTTNEGGEFTLIYSDGREGAIPGKYNVLFSKLTMPDGSPMPPDAMAADVGAVEQIPEKFRNTEMAIHFADVKQEAGGTFEFDLKFTPKK
jgi:hypothetical protein